mgnify:CR=1 FL=1
MILLALSKELSRDDVVIMSESSKLSVGDVAFTSRKIAIDVYLAISYSTMNKPADYITTYDFYRVIDRIFHTDFSSSHNNVLDKKVIPIGVKSICYDGCPLYGIKFDFVKEDNE